MGVLRDGSDEIDYITAPQSDDKPLAAYVFKTTTDKYVGTLNYLRVFSGKIAANDTLRNTTQESDERFNSLLHIRGKETSPATVLHAGDIGVVAKLNNTKTGDTFAKKGDNFQIVKPELPAPLIHGGSHAAHPGRQCQDGCRFSPASRMLTRHCAGDPMAIHARW